MKMQQFLNDIDEEMIVYIHLVFKNNNKKKEEYYGGIKDIWTSIKNKINLEYNKKYAKRN